MILKELMKENSEVQTLTESGRISAAAGIMREQRIGCLVIVDDDQRVVGVLTDRDIALGLALGAASPDSFVNELMSRDVVTINEKTNLFDTTRIFRSGDVKRLPVVDNDDRLVGIVTADDIMALLSREMFDTCRGLESKLGHLV